MRLVILTQYFYPEMGAPQSRLYEVAAQLQSMDWTVEVVTAMPNYPRGKVFPSYKGKFYLKEDVRGLSTHRYWLYPSNATRAFPRIMSMLSFSITALFSFFKIRKFKPDYLLVESPPLTVAFTGWMLSRLLRSKLIVNISDLWPLSAKELGAITVGHTYKFLLRLESFLYNKSDICTGQSQEIVDYISKIKKKNVWLLRNGVDITRFNKMDNTSARSNKIVYAGLIGVAQGIDSIYNNINFKELGLEFHIYGAGSGVNQLEKFVENNPNSGIKYCGVISRDQIPEVIGQYDAMLVSLVKHIYGAVPSKIYEAMAAGLPIVFSGEGEGARLVKENKIGWVSNPGNWKELMKNLKALIEISDSEFLDLKKRAKETAKDNFDRKNQILVFNNLLREYHSQYTA